MNRLAVPSLAVLLLASIAGGAPTAKRPIRIMVDAGHGGRDLGASGHFGTVEKDITLRISELVRRALQRHAALSADALDVRLTRDKDVFLPLRERARAANDWQADLFVSIHANSSDYAKAHGFEVYFLNGGQIDADVKRLVKQENDEPLNPGVLSILSDAEVNLHVNESSRFAETVFQAMSLSLRPNGRGVHQAPFTVLSGTRMPALLIEVGYLTNRDEAQKLKKGSYLKRIANAIGGGVIEFASQLRKVL